jgi:hypothetical protein
VLQDCRYLLHGRGAKCTHSVLAIIKSGFVKTFALPVRAPNLTAYPERWAIRLAKEECLSKLILFGERSLRLALTEYLAHCHVERNHQGRGIALLFLRVTETRRGNPVHCRGRLGGLLRYSHREAA